LPKFAPKRASPNDLRDIAMPLGGVEGAAAADRETWHASVRVMTVELCFSAREEKTQINDEALNFPFLLALDAASQL
jgi:hypothetical protein